MVALKLSTKLVGMKNENYSNKSQIHAYFKVLVLALEEVYCYSVLQRVY